MNLLDKMQNDLEDLTFREFRYAFGGVQAALRYPAYKILNENPAWKLPAMAHAIISFGAAICSDFPDAVKIAGATNLLGNLVYLGANIAGPRMKSIRTNEELSDYDCKKTSKKYLINR